MSSRVDLNNEIAKYSRRKRLSGRVVGNVKTFNKGKLTRFELPQPQTKEVFFKIFSV